MACILLWSSAVRVHDLQAYRKMDMTRECISRILELREILLSIQTGFCIVNAAVACAILESISAWNPHQLQLSSGAWSFWLSQASVHLLWSLCWCHWCCLSSAWSSKHWSPCHRLWRLCRVTHLMLQVLRPLLLSHWCHQQSRDWWLFCFQCWQCLHDLLRCLSWSFREICWRGWVRVDIPVRLELLFGTSLLYCCWRGLH